MQLGENLVPFTADCFGIVVEKLNASLISISTFGKGGAKKCSKKTELKM